MVLAENKVGKDQTFCQISVNLIPNVDDTPLINPDAFRFLENVPTDKKAAPDSDTENKDKYIPPHVIVPLSNVRISQGDVVRLACKIDGYPKPKV